MSPSLHIATIDALRERIQRREGGARHERAVLPFGIKAIDERLPEGGLALGALHEVAGGGNGAIDGAAAALFAAGIAARTRGRVLWCVTRQDLFAPALAAAGSRRTGSSMWKRETRSQCWPVLRKDCATASSARSSQKLPTLNDSFTETSARRGRLRRNRPRTAALAPPSPSRRVQAPNCRDDALAHQRATLHASASARGRPRSLATRPGPVPWWGLHNFRVGSV
jgi:hypothetical protein